MSAQYFSSIPDYNSFRFRATHVNRDEFVVYAVKLPADVRPLFFGAFSTLLDFNAWQSTDTVSAEEMTEIMNNDICWGEFCEFVADCITNNTLTQSALAQAIRENQEIRDAINSVTSTANHTTIVDNSSYSNASLIASNADSNGCDDDARFGRIVALIDYVDQVQLDFFETIDTAISILQEAENVYSAIPIAETLPVDELINIIATTGEQWRDSYEASVNTQLLEDFYCQLFCATNGCDVSVADVRLLILDRYDVTTDFGIINTLNIVTLIARIAATVSSAGGLAYIGDDFVYLSWLLQIVAVELSGEFFGVDLIDYTSQASSGSPSTLHTACPSCLSPFCSDFDFSTQDYGLSVWNDGAVDAGEYVLGSGFECRQIFILGTYRTFVELRFPFDGVILTSIEIVTDVVRGGYITNGQFGISVSDGSGSVFDVPIQDLAGTNIVSNWSGSRLISGTMRLYLQVDLGTPSLSGSGVIKRLRITGSAANYPYTINC